MIWRLNAARYPAPAWFTDIAIRSLLGPQGSSTRKRARELRSSEMRLIVIHWPKLDRRAAKRETRAGKDASHDRRMPARPAGKRQDKRFYAIHTRP